MAYILSIETSTQICSVAIYRDLELLSFQIIKSEKSHSSQLHQLIDKALVEAELRLNMLSAIAVSKGPGSYTGLRIGVSAAKGLCFSLDIPLISIETLQSMALEVREKIKENIFFCPMLDARRMEVYCDVLDSNMESFQGVRAVVLENNSFQKVTAKSSLICFGNGAEKFKYITENGKIRFIEGIFPSAEYIGKLAYQKYIHNDFEGVAYFEPFYLKEFLAIKPKAII